MNGRLSIVATPIGNLEDITLRAVRILKECDVVLCEDTRVTAKLLAKFDIAKPTLSYNAHSTPAKNAKVLSLLEEGKHLAFVSDAGTPAISDPGSFLVAEARVRFGQDLRIEAIPGASALTAALSVAGVPASEFVFLGFLPHKKGRETLFKEMASSHRPVVFFESPHRIGKALASLAKVVPDRTVTIARELTKFYEEIVSGTPQELSQRKEWKGEVVVILHPRS